MPSPPPVPAPGSIGAKLWNRLAELHTLAYRVTGGRLGGRMAGAPVLLLDHTGRKSGTRRTTPLLYLDDDPDLVVVGSRGGSKAPAAWYLNLCATPQTTVQVGSERRNVIARTAAPAERERLWPRLVELYPDYETYARRTDREIPVVVLRPEEEAGPAERSAGGR